MSRPLSQINDEVHEMTEAEYQHYLAMVEGAEELAE